MKRLIPFLLVSSLLASLAYAEDGKLQESNKPTWIERLFGLGGAESEDGVKEASKGSKKVEDPVKKVRKFTEEEREVLESWQKGNASWKKSKKPLPPGLQKKVDRGGELPPGWKKKLEVGTVLDPDVAAKGESLPEEILKRLPETEVGSEIIRVGTQIIKVIEGTREIVDIIDGDARTESE